MTLKPSSLFRVAVATLAMLVSVAQADKLDDILETKTLKVGVSLFEPWTMRNEAGDLSGFEIDVANQIAEDMGVEAEFVVYEWDEIISGLESGDIDVIAGGMAITPSRALLVDFSIPYADSGITLVANIEKTKDLNSLEEANQPSVVIAVVAGSAAEELVQNVFDNATILSFKDSQMGGKAVHDGEAHAFIASTPQPEFLALQYPEILDLPLSTPMRSYRAGLAVRKGEQPLLNFLNAWITARDADHWLEATHDYWFDSLDWRGE